jgi:hypothetical protein
MAAMKFPDFAWISGLVSAQEAAVHRAQEAEKNERAQSVAWGDEFVPVRARKISIVSVTSLAQVRSRIG